VIIGITGGIGSGKTTISQMFKNLGAFTLEADKLSREVLYPYSTPYCHIIVYYGNKIIMKDHFINRKLLRKYAFSDRKVLKVLEKIIHPYVIGLGIKKIYEKFGENHKNQIIIFDIPLLIEANLISLVDKIVVVYAKKSQQKERIIKRDKLDEKEAEKLISLQLSILEKIKFCDYIIDNSCSLDKTFYQVKKLFQLFLKMVDN